MGPDRNLSSVDYNSQTIAVADTPSPAKKRARHGGFINSHVQHNSSAPEVPTSGLATSAPEMSLLDLLLDGPRILDIVFARSATSAAADNWRDFVNYSRLVDPWWGRDVGYDVRPTSGTKGTSGPKSGATELALGTTGDWGNCTVLVKFGLVTPPGSCARPLPVVVDHWITTGTGLRWL